MFWDDVLKIFYIICNHGFSSQVVDTVVWFASLFLVMILPHFIVNFEDRDTWRCTLVRGFFVMLVRYKSRGMLITTLLRRFKSCRSNKSGMVQSQLSWFKTSQMMVKSADLGPSARSSKLTYIWLVWCRSAEEERHHLPGLANKLKKRPTRALNEFFFNLASSSSKFFIFCVCL